jgi:hypothetical protein
VQSVGRVEWQAVGGSIDAAPDEVENIRQFAGVVMERCVDPAQSDAGTSRMAECLLRDARPERRVLAGATMRSWGSYVCERHDRLLTTREILRDAYLRPQLSEVSYTELVESGEARNDGLGVQNDHALASFPADHARVAWIETQGRR